MNIEYLRILTEACKNNFEVMAKTKVVSVTVKREQRLFENYAVAFTCDFRGENQPMVGQILMGFGEEGTACHIAASISDQMHDATCREMDEMTLDVLAEFLNTVVGHTVNDWEEAGLQVGFDPVITLRNSIMATCQNCQGDTYVIILNLSFGQVVFSVSFRDTTFSIKGKKVLVVDDSRLVRGFLRQALEQLGLEVTEAGNGLEGKAKHQEIKPDLTIMDLIMPEMGGMDALAGIRETDQNAKFIILSSSAKQDQRDQAHAMAVSAYLLKPVKVDELVDAVKKALTV